MWHYKYMIHVDGLGTVQGLFLPLASDDDAARANMRISAQSDRRMRIIALYRTVCLFDELGDDTDYARLPISHGQPDASLYFLTGQLGRDLMEVFISADSSRSALQMALGTSWKKIRLHQCKEISM